MSEETESQHGAQPETSRDDSTEAEHRTVPAGASGGEAGEPAAASAEAPAGEDTSGGEHGGGEAAETAGGREAAAPTAAELAVEEESSFKYRTARSVFRGSIRAAHRPVITGAMNVPKTGPVIIASNHRSFADSIYLSALSPRRVSFMAKAEYFDGKNLGNRLVGGFMRSVGAFPVERGSTAAAVKALETGEEILRAGGVFGIYPEGTRSRNGEIGEGKTGAAELAIRTGATIVPVGLVGTEDVMPVDARFPQPKSFSITFGKAIPAPARQHPAGRQRRELTEQIMDAIRALVAEAEAEREAHRSRRRR
ncbi:lysophospholipid acyltransferase family protein [Brevibacterium album]|uniref:lysophospholipid acyltransferase family protein n=1 Tax=Brevibacterium album TaxID=417948 RepID=UPI0004271EA1|nr:lysophospholipid acyltransferase family protein [Brevibacterium album]